MHDLHPIFRPRSIAVIGASKSPGKIGWEIVHNIIRYGFTGKLFPVNPNADSVHSLKCYANIRDIEDEVDLAVIVVPRNLVLDRIEECGQKGVKGLVLITAGFKEVSEEGARLENLVAEKIKAHGMRMIGPNCMGVINTDPAVSMNATFAPELPIRGKIAFVTQSGALGVTILSLSRERNAGFSMFASIGNRTDISSNDLLEFWEDDPDAAIVLMYLENFGNPKHFAQIARRFAAKKPVLAVKSGRTLQGARAASSHTGALASADVASDAIFDQCGILRAQTIDELFDYATALVSQPLPKGNRIAILTNAGGPGIMATDACVSLGLQLPDFGEKTKTALSKILPPEANPNNPLDLLAGAGPEHYRKTLDLLLKDESVDAVLLINVPPIMIDPVEVATTVTEVASNYQKPVVGCFMGIQDILKTIQDTKRTIIPLYAFPESAAKALNALVRYQHLKGQLHGEPKTFDVQKNVAAQILEKARSEKRITLRPAEIVLLLQAYGIPTAPVMEVHSLEEAIFQARKLGYPVVMKAIMETRQHKSEFGGVMVDLRTDTEIIEAYELMSGRIREQKLEKDWQGFYLQPMIKGGKEVILGMTMDPTFGALLMFGMGGIYVETMKDVTFRIIPITENDAKSMIESIRGYPLLQGVRGEPPVDLKILAEALQRLSQLCNDFPIIKEIEINPFFVSSRKDSCLALDSRIYLKP